MLGFTEETVGISEPHVNLAEHRAGDCGYREGGKGPHFLIFQVDFFETFMQF